MEWTHLYSSHYAYHPVRVGERLYHMTGEFRERCAGNVIEWRAIHHTGVPHWFDEVCLPTDINLR